VYACVSREVFYVSGKFLSVVQFMRLRVLKRRSCIPFFWSHILSIGVCTTSPCHGVYTTFYRWTIYLILAMKYIPKFCNGVCTTIFRWSICTIFWRWSMSTIYWWHILLLKWSIYHFCTMYIPHFFLWWTTFHILAVEYEPHLAMENMTSGIYTTLSTTRYILDPKRYMLPQNTGVCTAQFYLKGIYYILQLR
jgi:hypothetical protein